MEIALIIVVLVKLGELVDGLRRAEARVAELARNQGVAIRKIQRDTPPSRS